MSVDAIGAIGHGDDRKAGRTENADGMKRKPWDEIGNALNGFGSYLNINPGNSVWTAGTNVQGAFGD